MGTNITHAVLTTFHVQFTAFLTKGAADLVTTIEGFALDILFTYLTIRSKSADLIHANPA